VLVLLFFFIHKVKHSKLSSHFVLCVFHSYRDCQKNYHCHDPTNHKLYVSHHVIFHKYIPLYSFPSNSHNSTRSDLICIDPFFINDDDVNNLGIENCKDYNGTTTTQDLPMTS
ncbi:hypothetical protein PHAVU_001G069100, partial [Phaseolus vulgaris]